MTLPQTPASRREQARLEALDRLDLLDTPPEDRFDQITALCSRVFGATAALNLVAADHQFTKSCAGLDDGLPDIAREDSFCSVAVGQHGPLIVEDATQDPRFADNRFVRDGLRFYAGQPVSTPDGAQVGALCVFGDHARSLDDADRNLLAQLAGWVEHELASDHELARAAAVQRGLHPITPPGTENWDIAGTCVTSRQVGGDLYDWYRCPHGISLCVADIMGKGMAAALMAATLRAVLRGSVRAGQDLCSAVSAASVTMAEDFADSGAFATVFQACFDVDSGYLAYVDAGHGFALLRRADGSLERVVSAGIPAGIDPDATWNAACLELRVGGQLCVFSDGVLDLHGGDVEATFDAVAEAMADETSAQAAVDRMVGPARMTRPDDDVTVVVVRRVA